MHWGIKLTVGWLMNEYTERPREFPSKQAAESWAKLSWPGKTDHGAGVITMSLSRFYEIKELKYAADSTQRTRSRSARPQGQDTDRGTNL